mgnify:FL=1
MTIVEVIALSIEVISKIVQIVEAAQKGELSPDEAYKRITALKSGIAEGRAEIDKLVDEKFEP